VLQKMKKQSHAQKLPHRDVALARHRLEIMCNKQRWQSLAQQYGSVLESTDLDDALRTVCAIKLADLGTSLKLKECSPSKEDSRQSPDPLSGVVSWERRVMQTREYRSPEVIVQLHPRQMITSAMDIWSIGCVTFELLTGAYLFNPRRFHSTHQAAIPRDAESATDMVHMKLIREILSSDAPQQLQRGGLNSAALFPNGSDAPMSVPATSTREGRLSNIIGLLSRYIVPNESADAVSDALRMEIARAGSFIARTLEWLPSERPTADELRLDRWLT
jgi:serine/threonine protein kinase